MSWSSRAYRALLWLYPAPFRGEYGAQMADLFSERLYRESAFTLWADVLADLICTVPKEHMNMLGSDIRHSLRAFAKAPAFVVFSVLSLALGIGVNTAIFQFVNTVLLQQLPARDPQELVGIARVAPKYYKTNFSYPLYRELRERTDVFAGVLARTEWQLSISWQSGAEGVRGELVSGNYFDVLGVGAALGRTLTADDERVSGGSPVAVLGYGFWERRFARDPNVLGSRILLAGHPFTIVGVSQKSFTSTEPGFVPDVRVPITMQNEVAPGRDLLHTRDVNWFEVIARIPRNVDLRQAQQVAGAVYRHSLESQAASAHTDPAAFTKDQRLVFFPADRGSTELRETLGQPLIVVLALSILVLLLTCANVANLMFARASRRQREFALRIALGAGRIRLIRHFMTESMLIAVIGGALGIALAASCGPLLPKLLPGAESITLEVHPTALTLTFAVAATVLSGLLFGLLPAWRSSKSDVAPALQEGFGGHSPGRWQAAVRNALVVAQVAFSTVLLLGASLFGRSLEKLHAVDMGFDRNHVYLFAINPSISGYNARRTAELYQNLLDRVRRLPAIESSSLARVSILGGGGSRSTVSVEGYQFKPGEDRNMNDNAITPGYLHTLKIPLLLGRDFTEGDRLGAPMVAIVNETAARYYFGTASPIGKRIGFGRDAKPNMEIVGVVKDGKYRNVREDTWRTIYVPFAQNLDRSVGRMTLHLRTAGDAGVAAARIRSVVHELDPNLPILSVESLADRVERNLGVERLIAFMSSSFGLLSLLLAALGLYGIIACSVSERTREVGIRIALGAKPSSVIGMIMRQAGLLLVVGTGIGLAMSLGLGRLVQSLLYGVFPNDAIAITITVLALGVTALLASYVPARRATKINPSVTLRYD